MSDTKESPNNSHEPVAYDSQGRPLYAHPPGSVVHIARSLEPTRPVISEKIALRHRRSLEMYPGLNLSEGEYIISAVRRHPIGLIAPLSVGTVVVGMLLAVLLNYEGFVETFDITGPAADLSTVTLPILMLVLLFGLGMFIIYYVYTSNRFFLTNESVIQEIQTSLFSKREQTVSLSNVEDASYTKRGIFQYLFDYGDIRLSTEGEETTYRFTYVANPKYHIAVLNNAVEAFKNGRPVDSDDN